MITCKVSDYLTITLKPDSGNEAALSDMLYEFIQALYLDDLLKLMDFKCSTMRYEQILRFSDIQIKIPYIENYKTQGICVEMSGGGLGYYTEYLSSHFNVDLRRVLGRFLALASKGYKPTCSRFDVAFDEIIKAGESKAPCLDLDVVSEALLQGHFVSHLRKSDPERLSTELSSSFSVNDIDDTVPAEFISSLDIPSGKLGKTIYLGKRRSSSFVRIYDKLVEQSAHGFGIDEDIIHWVRFEIEFKKNNAASVLVEYVRSGSDKAFIKYMRGVALNLIRFVVPDRSRKYNCTTCDWWLRFLKNASPVRLIHHKQEYNKFVRAAYSQKRQNSSTLAAIAQCSPVELVSIFRAGYKNPSKNALAIKKDYEYLHSLPPDRQNEEICRSLRQLSGIEFLRSFTDDNKDDFVGWINNLFNEVFPREVLQ